MLTVRFDVALRLMRRAGVWRWLVAGLLSLVAFPPALVCADHGGSVARADASSFAQLGDAPRPFSDASYRLVVGGQFEFAWFGRVLDGASPADGVDGASVFSQTLSTSLQLVTRRQTAVGIQLPVGVLVRAGSEEKTRQVGLGDMRLWVAQEWVTLKSPALARDVWFITRTGLSLPTGRYVEDAALSVLQLQPGAGDAQGALVPATYDTRASLGAGSTAWTGGLVLGGRLGDAWTGAASLGWQLPLHDTPDAIRWGADLQTAVSARYALHPSLGAGIQLDHRRHFQDLVPGVGDVGSQVRTRVGGRHEIGLAAQVDAQVWRSVRCAVQIRAPVFQHVGGIQLVETLSAFAICSGEWDFGRDASAKKESPKKALKDPA